MRLRVELLDVERERSSDETDWTEVFDVEVEAEVHRTPEEWLITGIDVTALDEHLDAIDWDWDDLRPKEQAEIERLLTEAWTNSPAAQKVRDELKHNLELALKNAREAALAPGRDGMDQDLLNGLRDWLAGLGRRAA